MSLIFYGCQIMKKKTSLKDIATRVGVSTTLVSYVLNNQKQGRISKEIASKIKEAAREMNYTTNHIALSLKTRKTFTLGLILADIANPFSSSLARIIQDQAEKSHYTVLFGNSDEKADKSWKLINAFLNRQVDGIILAAAEDTSEQVLYLKENEIPFVLIDRYFPGIDAPHVAIDNYQASYHAVRHLVEQGFRKPSMLTFDSSLFHLRERKRGYEDAIRDFGLKPSPEFTKEVLIDEEKENIEKAVQ